MKWVTRKNANVDRIACPWLIRRFVDPDAEFLFVPAEEVSAVAERQGAIPFDVKGAQLGHVDGRCSFESIMIKYQLTDPALRRLAKIVHGADIGRHRHRARGGRTEGYRARLWSGSWRGRPREDPAGDADVQRPLCVVRRTGVATNSRSTESLDDSLRA